MTSPEAREEAVLEAVRQRRELVNDAIPEELPIQRPERLYEASRYLLDAGGKRLRPTVLLTTAEALTDIRPLSAAYRSFAPLDESGPVDMMAAAVSVEVIQSFTLIHDDIMDDDDLRRGVPAVHKEYDLETAILAGDTLYSKAFEIMLETGAESDRIVDALSVLATTCTDICEGQSLDVTFEQRTDVTPTSTWRWSNRRRPSCTRPRPVFRRSCSEPTTKRSTNSTATDSTSAVHSRFKTTCSI